MFITGRTISWMARKIFLALASPDLIGVGRRFVFDPFSFPAMTGIVGIYRMVGGFIRC